MRNIFIVLLFLSTTIFSQKLSVNEIIEKVKSELNKVDDFSANVIVTVDMERIKVPKMDVSVLYKKPDKYSIKSKNFSMLPKEAIGFGFLDKLKDFKTKNFKKIKTDSASYFLIEFEKNVFDNEVPLNIILKIDSKSFLISEVITQNEDLSRTATINFLYNKFGEDIFLPIETTIKFDFNFPDNIKMDKKSNRTPREGKIKIEYQNYKINIGLNDSLFIDKK